MHTLEGGPAAPPRQQNTLRKSKRTGMILDTMALDLDSAFSCGEIRPSLQDSLLPLARRPQGQPLDVHTS